MKFIKLTTRDNEKLVLNARHIVSVKEEKDDYDGNLPFYAAIETTEDDHDVQESVDKIFEMLSARY